MTRTEAIHQAVRQALDARRTELDRADGLDVLVIKLWFRRGLPAADRHGAQREGTDQPGCHPRDAWRAVIPFSSSKNRLTVRDARDKIPPYILLEIS